MPSLLRMAPHTVSHLYPNLIYLPVVVIFTVDVPIAREAGELRVQGHMTLAAAQAGAMPLAVERQEVKPDSKFIISP